MSKSGTVSVSPQNAGVFHVENIPQESFDKANELLKLNHEQWHIFFNDRGFHNHTAHYLLTALALGRTPEQLDKAFHYQENIQRPRDFPKVDREIKDMSKPENFLACMSKAEYFNDYTLFFEAEISKRGVGPVLKEYLFSKTDIAEGMFTRLFASRYYPMFRGLSQAL